MNKVDNEFVKIVLKDNIAQGYYKKNVHIDLEAAKLITKERIQLQNNKFYPSLADLSGLKSITKEAREYFCNEGSVFISAFAFVGINPVITSFLNFYSLINNPPYPLKYFNNINQAYKWIAKYKEETNSVSPL